MAPVRLTVTGVPLHTVVLVIEVPTVGVVVTFTEITLFELQLPFIPVTVYDVDAEGLTVIAVVVCAPGIHK